MYSLTDIYDQALNTIQEKTVAKLRKELEQVRLKQPLDLDNTHIRRFASAVKRLHEQMKNAFEVEWKHCKDDIAQFIHDNETKLKSTFRNGDVKNVLL